MFSFRRRRRSTPDVHATKMNRIRLGVHNPRYKKTPKQLPKRSEKFT